jgi:hypothetical protein
VRLRSKTPVGSARSETNRRRNLSPIAENFADSDADRFAVCHADAVSAQTLADLQSRIRLALARPDCGAEWSE